MNNSVFGKTMENVRNRMEMHLTSDYENAVKWQTKHKFKQGKTVFGLYMLEMYKKRSCIR